ncbi:MAG: hypothetical protein AAFX99_10475 [Myxococcota bacterium]
MSTYTQQILLRNLAVCVVALGGCGDTSDSETSNGTATSDGAATSNTTRTSNGEPTACDYPEGVVEPMTLGEVIVPYAWPRARRVDGTDIPLELGSVPCATDPNIDWSSADVLLFISIPAWCPDCRIHARSVVEVEEQLEAAGAQLIWVMQETSTYEQGTAENCRDFMDELQSNVGLCIGEAETTGQSPEGANIFRGSEFAVARGIDLIVSRRDMVIRYGSPHGTPTGNENLTGEELLVEVQKVIDGL